MNENDNNENSILAKPPTVAVPPIRFPWYQPVPYKPYSVSTEHKKISEYECCQENLRFVNIFLLNTLINRVFFWKNKQPAKNVIMNTVETSKAALRSAVKLNPTIVKFKAYSCISDLNAIAKTKVPSNMKFKKFKWTNM